MNNPINPELLIERCSQQAIDLCEDQDIELPSDFTVKGSIPSDDQLLDAARIYWSGDSIYDQYDRKLAVQYIKHVFLTLF